MNLQRAFFLDRDGVLNRSIIKNGLPFSPRAVEEVDILENVLEAVEILKALDFVPVVITNQPDLSRGKLTIQELEHIHSFLEAEIGIQYFYVCPHDDSFFCSCRKPKPGLIIQASNDLGIDVSRSFLVGDRWKDISAGQAAGCQINFWIENSYKEKKPTGDFMVVSNLKSAIDQVIKMRV